MLSHALLLFLIASPAQQPRSRTAVEIEDLQQAVTSGLVEVSMPEPAALLAT